jgi:hypothetical protein
MCNVHTAALGMHWYASTYKSRHYRVGVEAVGVDLCYDSNGAFNYNADRP